MSTLTFAERFKDKSSTITIAGKISISPGRSIIKPAANQLHNSPPMSPGRLTLGSNPVSPQPSFFYRQSTQNIPLWQINSETHSTKLNISSSSPDHPNLKTFKTEPRVKFTGLSNKSDALRNNLTEKKEFKPYSIGDYFKIRPKNYCKLGGLGANIGNEDWIKRKNVNDRRGVYARSVNRGVKLSNEGYGIKMKGTNRLNWRDSRDD